MENGRFQHREGSCRSRATADWEDIFILLHLPLTPAHCQAKLQWCLARSGWNHADWRRIVFSDESCFQLYPDDPQRRVWRRPGQCPDLAFTIARQTGPQPGVMVWGAISFDSGTPLVVIRGILAAQRALLVEWLRQQTKRPHSSEANPQVYVETQLHPEKLTVWCALWAGRILLQKR
ncbi:transposable element Tc1 transposase [Trichonephila clavipes]|nr:transposable element Tc1 transposase [Trichonephila clavipes]